MTQNQLTAVRNSEIARNNRALEKLRDKEIEESKRHSVVTEQETKRHNLNTELIENLRINETHRSNVANESIGIMNAYTNKYNAESNRMSAKANLENARTNRTNATTNYYKATLDAYNARTSALRAIEDIRHDKAVEKETQRNNDLMNSINLEKNRISARNAEIAQQEANQRGAVVQQGWQELEIKRINAYTNAGSAIMNAVGDAAKAAAMAQ